MGGKEVDETALLRLLALSCTKPSSSSSPCTSLSWNIPLWSLFCQLGTTDLLHDRLLLGDPHLCSDLLDAVPWPGRGGVPQVRPGLEGAISILLCPPTMCTKHTCLDQFCVPHFCTNMCKCTCLPILAHHMLKKASVPQSG